MLSMITPILSQPCIIALKKEEKVLDILEMINNMSEDKQMALADYLKNVLSCHLGNFVDDKIPYSTCLEFSVQKMLMMGMNKLLTTSKQHFLETFEIYFRKEIGECFLKENVAEMLKGKSLTYTMKDVINIYKAFLGIYKKHPKRYPEIEKISEPTLESLHDLLYGNPDYKFGLELDIDETQKQKQLVFATFEKNGHSGNSRMLIPESDL